MLCQQHTHLHIYLEKILKLNSIKFTTSILKINLTHEYEKYL